MESAEERGRMTSQQAQRVPNETTNKRTCTSTLKVIQLLMALVFSIISPGATFEACFKPIAISVSSLKYDHFGDYSVYPKMLELFKSSQEGLLSHSQLLSTSWKAELLF